MVCSQAVPRCWPYHDSLEDAKPKKIPKSNRGLCLLTNSYDRAEEDISTIEQDILPSEDATNIIVDHI